MTPSYIDITSVLMWVVSALALVFIVKYNWSRRWLYYYASKMDGPFAWPIIGSAHHFIGGQNVFYKKMIELIKSQPPIFKFWLGNELLVVTTRPEDIEIVLSNCFERPKYYNYSLKLFGNGILLLPANIWKERRKLINPTFNPQVLNSFIGNFGKHSNIIVRALEELCGQEIDVFMTLFKYTLNLACETLANVDSSLLKGQENYIQQTIKLENFSTIRSFSIWLQPDIVWNHSPYNKKGDEASSEIFGFIKQVLRLKKSNLDSNKNKTISGENKKRCLVDHLLKLSQTNPKINDSAIEDEAQTILLTGSETTAITIGMALIVLGIYPEIEEKIVEELDFIFGNDDRIPTLEDINQMEYLERVIKETMRVLPTVPLVLRTVDKDIKLDPYTIPAGTLVLVPTGYLGQKPEFWDNPEKFDPDRFLPENCSKRHRSSFLPFSYGPRNCIGFKYGMMSMKVLLAAILRKYTPKPSQYKKLEEIDLVYGLISKPKDGFKVILEKRIVSN